MPKKAADKTETDAPKRVIVRAKDNTQFMGLIKKAQDEHWRVLRVEIMLREWMLAGKPASLDAANAMLKARGLDDHIEAVADITDPTDRAAAAERVASTDSLCEFTRRPGKNGIWMPSNNVKAGLKENWSVLGLRMDVRGSRGALAEGMFVVGVGAPDDKEWIRVGDQPSGVYTNVAHTTGPSGPVSSIKRHEYVDKAPLAFDIMIANVKNVADKISDDELAKTLVHFQEHGLGAGRSQGFGKFDVVSVTPMGEGD